MANYTKNYNLKKPLPNEFYDVEDQNGNMDILDTVLAEHQKNTAVHLPEDGILPVERGGTGGVTAADARAKLGAAGNPNLLDNWYFADPIDQRGGYIVPPNTPYYSNTALTAQVGTVSTYTKAVYVNGTYGTITVGSATYYVDWSAAVRGYVGEGYGIDRWCQNPDHSNVITDTGVLFNDNSDLFQFVDGVLWEKTVTLSALTDRGMLTTTFTVPESGTEEIVCIGTVNQDDIGCIGAYTLLGHGLGMWVSMFINEGVTLTAVKLELGSVQTLAHQDADGNWVLNDPPPNKALELAKCQRYYEKSVWQLAFGYADNANYINSCDNYFFKAMKRIHPVVSVNPNQWKNPQVFRVSTGEVVSDVQILPPLAVNTGMLCARFYSPSGAFVPNELYQCEIGDDAYLIIAEL